jgi:hypothetical protein
MVVLMRSSVLLLLLDAVEVVPSVPVALSSRLGSCGREPTTCHLVAGCVLASASLAAGLHAAAVACTRKEDRNDTSKVRQGNIFARRRRWMRMCCYTPSLAGDKDADSEGKIAKRMNSLDGKNKALLDDPGELRG